MTDPTLVPPGTVQPAASEPMPAKGPGLAALPEFIRYTSSHPEPRDLLRALRSGLLRRHGMQAGFLWRRIGDSHLSSLASIGHDRDIVERYSVLPLELDLAAVRSAVEGVITMDPADGFGGAYLQALDDELLTAHLMGLQAASIINVPLRHAGSTVGVLGFITSRPWVDDEHGRALLTALDSLLGLWLTHPRTRAVGPVSAPPQREWSLAFTERQKQALMLAGEGHSTAEIARRLVVSNSSVKQDLQHTMRALRTHSRLEACERARDLGLLSS